MLTGIHIKNFKKLKDVEIELGQAVVLIGPNNSGKTAALQALALWELGLRRWTERRKGNPTVEKRSGVAINRRDLISVPVPSANLLWRDLHVRDVKRVEKKPQTRNVRIDITVDGVTGGKPWSCGLEFDYSNDESFVCRPLRLSEDLVPKRMPIPPEALSTRVAFLPPMSGLADREFFKQYGEIGVLIGQGQTAQVLRNLCYQIYERSEHGREPSAPPPAAGQASATNDLVRDATRRRTDWRDLSDHILRLFGVTIRPPLYSGETSEITMTYIEQSGTELDISSSGRGLQQTLLLLAHLYANSQTVLLLDEPDAHLEVLRQRETYQLLTGVAQQQGSQIIAASHSEVVLDEAADKDIVIAFVGRRPHRIDDRGSQLLKSLKDIGFEDYYSAEQNGWVLYLEGPTDLAMLQAFARTAGHEASAFLQRPFVRYVGNQPSVSRHHFRGLLEACPDLIGIAIYDRLSGERMQNAPLREMMWRRRELENYLALEEVLIAYARGEDAGDLFSSGDAGHRIEVMRTSISELTDALRTLKKLDPWSPDIKASDDFLTPLFENYFEKLGLPNQMRKNSFYVLAQFVPKDKIDPEIIEKLDAIVEVAKQAKPAEE